MQDLQNYSALTHPSYYKNQSVIKIVELFYETTNSRRVTKI